MEQLAESIEPSVGNPFDLSPLIVQFCPLSTLFIMARFGSSPAD